MRNNPISSEFTSTVMEVLRFSDMVKFAKFNPSDPQDDEIIQKTRYSIELGREPLLIDEAPAGPESGPSSSQSEGEPIVYR